MKYYLIAGEASGDLHASRLMQSLRLYDPEAEFRFFGGDLMTKAGGNWPTWDSSRCCCTCPPSSGT